jgi:hypothetical protein
MTFLPAPWLGRSAVLEVVGRSMVAALQATSARLALAAVLLARAAPCGRGC